MKAKFCRGKKSKSQNLKKRSKSSKAMPCQSNDIDFQKLFFNDRQSHNKLSTTYLQKISQYQKQSLRVHKQFLDLQTQQEMTEKYNQKLYKQNKKLKRENKCLVEENQYLQQELEQFKGNQNFQIEKMKKNFVHETDLFHKYYQKKIQELRNMYKCLLTPEQLQQIDKAFSLDEEKVQSVKNFQNSNLGKNFDINNTQPNFNGIDIKNHRESFQNFMQNKKKNFNLTQTKNL